VYQQTHFVQFNRSESTESTETVSLLPDTVSRPCVLATFCDAAENTALIKYNFT